MNRNLVSQALALGLAALVTVSTLFALDGIAGNASPGAQQLAASVSPRA